MTTTTLSIASTLHTYLATTARGDGPGADAARALISDSKMALADALLDAGHDALADDVRKGLNFEDVVAVLNASGLKVGRKRMGAWLEAEAKAATVKVYEPRRDRQVNPKGTFDSAGRWFPSKDEDGGDIVGSIRSPSRSWPYTYLVACRTKKHCAVLVRWAILGVEVPADVKAAARPVRDTMLSELSK